MLADIAPAWTTGHGEERFDSPKCMLRWTMERDRDAATGWVTEYYTGEQQSVADVMFVVGSDVIGPMGDDFVPIGGRMRADLFVRDHGGRVVLLGDIDAAVLRDVDQR